MSTSMVTTTPAGPPAQWLAVDEIRSHFPTIDDASIYLDSVASSLTPLPVLDAMSEYYTRYRANIHRGSYDASLEASEHYEHALNKVAGFIGAEPEEVVFTTNTTMAINMVALSLDFEPGDEIVLSTLEHTSNMAPWARLAAKAGVTIRWYNAGVEGVFDVDEFAKLLGERTRLVSLTHVSNVLGTVVPVEQVAELCQARGILFLVDGAQSVPHLPVDVGAIGCDFLAFSGHKMLGPTGIGVLFIKRRHAEDLLPAIAGGGTIDTEAECRCPSLDQCGVDYVTFQPLPYKWQAGTPPIAEAIGLAAAIDYLEKLGMESVRAHDQALVRLARERLAAIPEVELFGPTEPEQGSSIVSFNIGDLPPHEVGRILDERFHIAVRTGKHCALSYFKGTDALAAAPGNVRAGFYIYNTEEEVGRLAAAVEEIAAVCLRGPAG
jgi:cysteine desulfurase/selenocysteine lyase